MKEMLKMFWLKVKFEFFILTLVDGTWEEEFCTTHNISISWNGRKVW